MLIKLSNEKIINSESIELIEPAFHSDTIPDGGWYIQFRSGEYRRFNKESMEEILAALVVWNVPVDAKQKLEEIQRSKDRAGGYDWEVEKKHSGKYRLTARGWVPDET